MFTSRQTEMEIVKFEPTLVTPVTQRQPKRQRTTNATEINKQSQGVKYLCENTLPRITLIRGKLFTPYSRLLISTAFALVSRVGCLGATSVLVKCRKNIYILLSIALLTRMSQAAT